MKRGKDGKKPQGTRTNQDAHYDSDKYKRPSVDKSFVNAAPAFERNGADSNWMISEGEEHKTGMEDGPTNSFHTWEHHRGRRVHRHMERPVNIPEDGAHNLE